MRKFLPFSKRQPSLDRLTISRGGWTASNRSNGNAKSLRRTSASSLNTKSIQVVRGAYNIDLNKVDSSFTKLHKACLLNDDVQVKKHIHKVDNNSRDSSNRYPIHLATVNGNFAIIKLLIENGANPNVRDNEGNTPIIKSIECGHEHLVKYLISNGADPNLTDLDNNTALHWAILTESIIAIDALVSSRKCDVSARNNRDETCLHLAVRCPLINASTFEALVESGSDLTLKDQLGLTAVDIAQACGNKTAMNIFSRQLKELLDQTTACDNGCDNLEATMDSKDQKTVVRKLYDDYKLKYVTKNRENLEYEKKLIHLTAQVERMKLDLSYVKKQNDKFKADHEQLSIENNKLKTENSELLERIRKYELDGEANKQIIQRSSELTRSFTQSGGCSVKMASTFEGHQVNSPEIFGHEEFLSAKTFLQERINKLKSSLTTAQP